MFTIPKLTRGLSLVSDNFKPKFYLVLFQAFRTAKKKTRLVQSAFTNINITKQAGTVLGQAQLKLELEIYFTSFKICCIKLVKIVKLC